MWSTLSDGMQTKLSLRSVARCKDAILEIPSGSPIMNCLLSAFGIFAVWRRLVRISRLFFDKVYSKCLIWSHFPLICLFFCQPFDHLL